jgi:hypothetical protein
VDSQIVKCADTVGTVIRGYHGGKKITGRGRHLAVDCAGWLLALVVTAASVSDKLLDIKLFNAFTTPADHVAMVYWATVSACVSNRISIDMRRGYAGTSTVARRSQSSPSVGPMDPDVMGATVAPRKSSRSDSGTQIISAAQSEVSI